VSFSSPTTFQFAFIAPINFSRDVTSQTNLGAALMDLFSDGASLTGNTPAGKLSTFAFNNTTHTQLGPSFSAVGLAGSELDSGVATIGCSELSLCTETEFGFNFILSAIGDGAALIARQEIGGDPITGTVMQIYALASQTNVFDCGTGCDLSEIELSFSASGGNDAYGFIVRQEVIPFVAPAVPEPPSIALVGLGIAGWFATRRRNERTPVRG
jgi:hypothetical protein